MTTFDDLYIGLKILRQYKQEDDFIDAQHQEIFVGGPPPNELPPDQQEKLEERSWYWDEKFECWVLFT